MAYLKTIDGKIYTIKNKFFVKSNIFFIDGKPIGTLLDIDTIEWKEDLTKNLN